MFRANNCFKLFSLLCAFVLLLSSCASASYPDSFDRKHFSKDDIVKFYNLDWLSDVRTVKEAFENDFGKDSFIIDSPTSYNVYGDTLGSFKFYLHSKNGRDEPLLWELGNSKIHSINLYFINRPDIKAKASTDDDLYLYEAKYIFVEEGASVAKKMKQKLDSLYGDGVKGSFENSYNYIWKDENGNTIELYHNDPVGIVKGVYTLAYRCGDMLELLEQGKSNNVNKNQKQDAADDKL